MPSEVGQFGPMAVIMTLAIIGMIPGFIGWIRAFAPEADRRAAEAKIKALHPEWHVEAVCYFGGIGPERHCGRRLVSVRCWRRSDYCDHDWVYLGEWVACVCSECTYAKQVIIDWDLVI